MNTGRLEAFSDGVFAVAATLLVLNVTVPIVGEHGSLARTLGHQWQVYVAYANSFITIGIIWINHHAMISRLRSADHPILILNLLLLMWVALLPFATSLMTDYLRLGHGGLRLRASEPASHAAGTGTGAARECKSRSNGCDRRRKAPECPHGMPLLCTDPAAWRRLHSARRH